MAGGPWDIGTSDVAQAAASKPFDVIIVGGGSAGLTTAIPLVAAGLKTALLEAGPAPFLQHISNTDLRFAPDLGRALRNVTLYMPGLASGGTFGNNYGCLGGRGLFWNGAAPRYSDDDLSGWPLGAADLADDYAWAEREFRVGTSMGRTPLAQRIIAKLNSAGLAAEPGPFAADIDDLYVGRLGAGIASGLGPFFRHCGNAVADGGLTVAVNTRAARLLVAGDKVTGVAAVSGDSAAEVEIPARAVVLAGGGIESIKLAAVSGVPDPHQRIGKGMQEHLFYHALLNAEALYDREKRDSGIVFVRAASQDLHQWELHVPGNRLFAIDDGVPWQPDASPPYQVMIRSFAATEKRDDNRVEAAPGPLGSSTVHFTHSPKDEDTKRAMAADAETLCNALGASPAVGPAIGSIERFRPPGSSYHEAGGLDMGDDPANSVTDADGRFHSVGNLYCNDAAAFPRIGATNPHLTIVAVAHRKASALARELS